MSRRVKAVGGRAGYGGRNWHRRGRSRGDSEASQSDCDMPNERAEERHDADYDSEHERKKRKRLERFGTGASVRQRNDENERRRRDQSPRYSPEARSPPRSPPRSSSPRNRRRQRYETPDSRSPQQRAERMSEAYRDSRPHREGESNRRRGRDRGPRTPDSASYSSPSPPPRGRRHRDTDDKYPRTDQKRSPNSRSDEDMRPIRESRSPEQGRRHNDRWTRVGRGDEASGHNRRTPDDGSRRDHGDGREKSTHSQARDRRSRPSYRDSGGSRDLDFDDEGFSRGRSRRSIRPDVRDYSDYERSPKRRKVNKRTREESRERSWRDQSRSVAPSRGYDHERRRDGPRYVDSRAYDKDDIVMRNNEGDQSRDRGRSYQACSHGASFADDFHGGFVQGPEEAPSGGWDTDKSMKQEEIGRTERTMKEWPSIRLPRGMSQWPSVYSSSLERFLNGETHDGPTFLASLVRKTGGKVNLVEQDGRLVPTLFPAFGSKAYYQLRLPGTGGDQNAETARGDSTTRLEGDGDGGPGPSASPTGDADSTRSIAPPGRNLSECTMMESRIG